MADTYDVVIVGGGHNGLVAGSYLGKAGKKVLIVERSAVAGGMSRSDYAIPEAPDHMVNTGAVELIHIRASPVFRELELVRHGFRTVDPDPSYAYLDPDGGSIAVFRDPRRTAEDIARFSKADAKAYLEFMQLIDALMDFAGAITKGDPAVNGPGRLRDLAKAAIRNRRLRRELTVLQSSPADQFCLERFEHPATQALLLSIVAGAGPFDVDGNAIAYALFGLLHRVGVGKPIGGMRMIADVLQSAYAESGGELLLDAEVEEILIEGGKATGVRLKGGRVIGAAAVIATCDPQTLAKLTTKDALPRETLTRLQLAPANRSNIGPNLINVAMNKPLSLRKHQDLRTDGVNLNHAVGMIGTVDELRADLIHGRRGTLSPVPTFSLSPLTNTDPSQAPEGHSTAYIYLPLSPVELQGGWAKNKAKAADAIIARAAQYYDGFDGEIGRWFETCQDRAKRVNVTNGCVTHVDFGSFRSGTKRPAVELGNGAIVPGLFIGGSGSHPGGGVSGGPGRLSSQRVQAYLAK
jgi:phytoene dehydrogenase-like protein